MLLGMEITSRPWEAMGMVIAGDGQLGLGAVAGSGGKSRREKAAEDMTSRDLQADGLGGRSRSE